MSETKMPVVMPAVTDGVAADFQIGRSGESPMGISRYVLEQQAGLAQLSTIYAKSGLVPRELAGKPEAVFVILTTGMELGIGFATALRSIYVQNQRPVLSADLMVGVAMQAGATFEYQAVLPPAPIGAVVGWKRGASKGVTSFTLEDAARAGLDRKDNWLKYPMAMCLARAKAAAARQAAPDRLAGLYTPDELGNEAPVAPEEIPESVLKNLHPDGDVGEKGCITVEQELTMAKPSDVQLGREPERQTARRAVGSRPDIFDQAAERLKEAQAKGTEEGRKPLPGKDAPSGPSVVVEQEDEPVTMEQLKVLRRQVDRLGLRYEKTGMMVRVLFPDAVWQEWGITQAPTGDAAWVTVWQRDNRGVHISAREMERALNALDALPAGPTNQQTAIDMAEGSFA